MKPKKPKHKKVEQWMYGSRVGNKHSYKKVALKEYDIQEMNAYLDKKWLAEGGEVEND